jgi:hypothetical protein
MKKVVKKPAAAMKKVVKKPAAAMKKVVKKTAAAMKQVVTKPAAAMQKVVKKPAAAMKKVVSAAALKQSVPKVWVVIEHGELPRRSIRCCVCEVMKPERDTNVRRWSGETWTATCNLCEDGS